jgi:DNA-directed RNA polymerase beta subunit
MFNPVVIRSENYYVEEHDKYVLEIAISFDNIRLQPPIIIENNGAVKTLYPHEAKLRNFTYGSMITSDLKIDYTIRDTMNMDDPVILTKTLPKIILQPIKNTFWIDSPHQPISHQFPHRNLEHLSRVQCAAKLKEI